MARSVMSDSFQAGGQLQTVIQGIQNIVVKLGDVVAAIDALNATVTAETFQVTGTDPGATAGAGVAVPANVDAFLVVDIPGVGVRKIPYFLS